MSPTGKGFFISVLEPHLICATEMPGHAAHLVKTPACVPDVIRAILAAMTNQQSITISSDTLCATILPQGAALVGVRFAGQTRNLVIGFADPADHTKVPICAGSLVGPIANRVQDGRVTLDGQTYQMPQNENTNCLHSGPDGLHTRLWQIELQTPESVTLSCALADGMNGLPGNRQILARYSVEADTLTLTITATTDRATPMNVAAHPYWNLDGTPDVGGHRIAVNATQYLPTDPQGLPTGERHITRGSEFDFETEKPVPLSPALDVNFCLASAPLATPTHAATLTGSDGTRLDIATTAPGLQVYAGASLPDLAVEMADCPPLKPYSGIALEPQHWPDAPHHDHFPQITLVPGQTYAQSTHFRLTPP
ncbi:galactose mutarotase [Sulfitobacter sp. SK011]|nr:galactose mutarotase [Sulfitobacter sp. SK011]